MKPRSKQLILKGQRRSRAKELVLLAESRRTANPREVSVAAGFWLRAFRGKGRHE